MAEKNFCYVTWDVDLTGRRLIDEICQLAAYTPTDKFRQFIMPHRDIDVVAKKKYMIKTVNVGRYRVLKETHHGKVLKTKSELYALLDFITWLETLKGQSNGIILLNYEAFKLAPFLLIEALKRCKLYDRFSRSVCGFINIYPFVKDKCSMSMSSFSLRLLSKILLNKENEDIYSAFDRARIIYEILKHLCAGDSEDDVTNIYNNVNPLLKTVEQENTELCSFQEELRLQKTLKPIFYDQFSMNQSKRNRATYLRKILTSKQVDYSNLQNVMACGKESLVEYISQEICPDSEVDAKDLIDIISSHFTKPNTKYDRKQKPRRNTFKQDAGVPHAEIINNVEGDVTNIVHQMQTTSLSDKQC